MHQSALETYHNHTDHEQSTTALASLQKAREPASGPMVRWSNRMSLATIATAMKVPVVIATFRAENYVQTVATHGLDLMNNLARFAAICDRLCSQRVVVIPDTRIDPELAKLARHWPSDDICFLVGVPLRNSNGQRTGSLCVMNTSRAVAQNGISFRTLSEIGKEFAETGRLQPATLDI